MYDDFFTGRSDIRPMEMHKSSECRDRSTIHQIAIMIYDINVDSQIPHLNEKTYESQTSLCNYLMTSSILVTFLSATIQRDSRSTHFESLKHFSSCLLINMAASDCLPLSKCCAANGVSSTFMRIIPSLARDVFGCCISHDTCATTL